MKINICAADISSTVKDRGWLILQNIVLIFPEIKIDNCVSKTIGCRVSRNQI